MDYKKNNKYFSSNGMLFLVGVPLIIVGIFLCAFVLRWRTMWIGVVTIAAGIALSLGLKSSAMSDEDFDQVVKNAMNDIEAHSSEVFKFPRRYEVLHPNVILGNYDFTRTEETPVKRGHDLKYRNGFYSGVLFNFTNDGLRIDSRKFSLLHEDMKEDILYFKWEEVEGAQLDEEEYDVTLTNGKPAKVKGEVFRLKMKDGAVYSYSVKNTADVDEAIDCIYRQTVRVKQEELKARAEAAADNAKA